MKDIQPGHSMKDVQAIAVEQVFPKDQPIFQKEQYMDQLISDN